GGKRDEEHRGVYVEGAGREHEQREGEWRRNEIEHGERNRAALTDAAPDPGETLFGRTAIEAFVADLGADEKGEGRARERPSRRDQRHEPWSRRALGHQNHDDGVDAE